jgi:hypothetical protein
MNWPQQCAILACATNTSLDVIWKMTLGQFCRYFKCLPALMPFHNPFAGSAEGGGTPAPARPGESSIDADRNPKQAIAAMVGWGAHLKKRKT